MAALVVFALLGAMGVQVVAQEESAAAPFPTGTLVSVENPNLLLTLNQDGTGEARDLWTGLDVTFVYATHDDLYTEMWNDSSTGLSQVPVTYFWDFDGEQLTMELWGRDLEAVRRSFLGDNTFTPIEDPRAVVVAPRDIEVGEPVFVMMAFAPAAQLTPDVFTATQDVVGSVAASPIVKGQPIVPEMLEPAE